MSPLQNCPSTSYRAATSILGVNQESQDELIPPKQGEKLMEAVTISENIATVCIMIPALIQLYYYEIPYVELSICHHFKFVTTGWLYFSEE